MKAITIAGNIGGLMTANFDVGKVFWLPRNATYFSSKRSWALAHGEWPEAIDHANGDRSDNRLINLQRSSVTENNRNMKRRKDNSSGVVGVCWDAERKKWMATIAGRSLGRFDDFTSAVTARSAAAVESGFHANHGAR